MLTTKWKVVASTECRKTFSGRHDRSNGERVDKKSRRDFGHLLFGLVLIDLSVSDAFVITMSVEIALQLIRFVAKTVKQAMTQF